MAFKVEVISKDTITPSSPTPHHLRAYKSCFFDEFQIASPIHIILSYSSTTTQANNIVNPNHLKTSLSNTLTQFYPLAGRIIGDRQIICNDEGVNFYETRVVGCQLSQVVSHPKIEELSQLFSKDELTGLGLKPLLSVQLNTFECGGTAIGVSVTHKIGDMNSISLFLNTWAAIARGENDIIPPKFELASIFPPQNLPSFDSSTAYGPPTDKLVLKRFVFHAWAIDALKEKFLDNNPTPAEVLNALIWGCINSIVSKSSNSIASTSMFVAVDVRPRMLPPLSESSFGNCTINMFAKSNFGNHDDLNCLVTKVQGAIRKCDNNYARKVHSYDELLPEYTEFLQEFALPDVEICGVQSWCGYPLYETDFGWGKPVCVCPINWLLKNGCFFMDTKCRTGVEVWVCLNKEDMVRFEQEDQIVAFTSELPTS